MLSDRFWSKVDKTPTCWNWTGAKTREGYGHLQLDRRYLMAHRVAYEDAKGPIPRDKTLDHLCRNHACVNPDHLEPTDRGENVRRGFVLKTHCKNGHPLTEGNLRSSKDGRWRCLTCHRERMRRVRNGPV